MDYGIGVDERVYYNLASLYSKPEWGLRVTAPSAILPGDWPETTAGGTGPGDFPRAFATNNPRSYITR